MAAVIIKTIPKKKYPKRGFASMDKEKQRKIAQAGGISAQKQGLAHKWNPQTASDAGRLGGAATAKNKREATQ
jgi:general stress protein YciG